MGKITKLNDYKKEKIEKENEYLDELDEKLDIDGEKMFGFLLGLKNENGVDETLKERFLSGKADVFTESIVEALSKAKEIENRYNNKK